LAFKRKSNHKEEAIEIDMTENGWKILSHLSQFEGRVRPAGRFQCWRPEESSSLVVRGVLILAFFLYFSKSPFNEEYVLTIGGVYFFKNTVMR
jgi:hypothetical protein